MSSQPAPSPASTVFRLPRSSYLAVLFLVFCVIPAAFADLGGGPQVVLGPRVLFLLVPVTAALYVARTATAVDAAGIDVRALLGSRRLGWGEVRGLSVTGRSVYAVGAAGSVRLPCVRIADLAAVSRASGGRLPELEEAPAKLAPARRRR